MTAYISSKHYLALQRSLARDQLFHLLAKFDIKDRTRTLTVTSINQTTKTITVSWK